MISKPVLYKDDRSFWHLRWPRHQNHPYHWAPGIHSYGASPSEVWIRFLRFEDARGYIAGDYDPDRGW
jgi:hypothetical protein